MEWALIAALPVVFVCVVVWLYRRIAAKARAVKDRIMQEHGADLRLISGCGIVCPPSRVPGVLALTRDRLFYESLTSLAGGKDEVLLADIAGVRWVDPRASSQRMARKYRRARVLEITSRGREALVFVLAKAQSGPWEQALPATTH